MTPEQQAWTPKYNPWLIAVVVAMAAFMEVLDTSIANVALPHIAGDLGASNDESTWVLTSYLVSNAIILPVSGWLAQAIGRKRFFMLCIFLFTLSSMLCGAAFSLPMLILFRVMQGVGGGGLQPMAQAILADIFPPQKRGLAFALYGITAVMAPTIGPTLGGWITDNYSWRWIFYINLPVGILALFLVLRLVEDPPWLAKLKGQVLRIDYIGIGLLTLGIGALQILLDKGQEDDWFGSNFILTLGITAAVCLVGLVIWEWNHEAPIIEKQNPRVRRAEQLQAGLISVPPNPHRRAGSPGTQHRLIPCPLYPLFLRVQQQHDLPRMPSMPARQQTRTPVAKLPQQLNDDRRLPCSARRDVPHAHHRNGQSPLQCSLADAIPKAANPPDLLPNPQPRKPRLCRTPQRITRGVQFHHRHRRAHRRPTL